MRGANPAEPEVWISRVLDAPRDLVFRAWTEPGMLAGWYAPHGCTFDLVRMDVRVGGSFHRCIHNPDHKDCWVMGAFHEVVSPERLVYSTHFSDATGRRLTLPPSRSGVRMAGAGRDDGRLRGPGRPDEGHDPPGGV